MLQELWLVDCWALIFLMLLFRFDPISFSRKHCGEIKYDQQLDEITLFKDVTSADSLVNNTLLFVYFDTDLLTSSMSPAGLKAGSWDTVSCLWCVGEVRQAAYPVLDSAHRTVLQPCHNVPDWQTPGSVSCRTLDQNHTGKQNTWSKWGKGNT